VHYKQEVKKMTEMLQEYEQNRSLESVREVARELIRLTQSQQGRDHDPLLQKQTQEYLRVLA
jgi:hypothetical protein